MGEGRVVAPLTHERRQQVVLAVAAAACKASPILMGTGMAVLVERAGGSPLAIGLVLTVYFFGLMVFSPVWGAVADATGERRKVLLVASVLAVAAALPLTVVEGVWAPLGVRTVYAAFAAGYLPILLTIASERGGDAGRGRSIGLFSSAQAVGFAAANLLAGYMLGAFAPWALYLLVAAFAAVVVLAALVLDDPTPDGDARLSAADVAGEVLRRLFPAEASRRHFRRNGLRWLYVAVFLRNATVIGTTSLAPVYFVSTLGVSEATMGVLLAINPAAQVAFMYLVGRVADDSGRKSLITLGMAGSGAYPVLTAAATLPAPSAGRIAVAAAAMAVLAAAFSALRVGAVSFIGDVAPENRESELIGFRSTARGFGGMLGPVLVGTAASAVGYEAAFALVSLLAFTGAVIVAATLVESFDPEATVVAGDD